MIDLSPFSVRWHNLSFETKLSLMDKILLKLQGYQNVPNVKTVLHGVSGQFSSGQLTAVMGPSGSGKSTLLKCICKQNLSGRSGDINVTLKTGQSSATELRFAFIPQEDKLFDQLTVKESVLFAAKLYQETSKSRKWIPSGQPLRKVVDKALDTLGLTVCADNKVGVCSGGQQKRLSIAQELVRKPNFLILDEPTSGLDSSSCDQLIKYLKELTKSQESMAIVATIHQPSYRVLCYFDSLYILSRNGYRIYSGPPRSLVSHFSKFDFNCPEFYNPADYALEVASGVYGLPSLQEMEMGDQKDDPQVNSTSQEEEDVHREGLEIVPLMSENPLVRPLAVLLKEPKHPLISHSLVIAGRSLTTALRDPYGTGIRLGINLTFGLVAGFLYRNLGLLDGCPIRSGDHFDPSDLEMIQNATKFQTRFISDNVGNFIASLLFLLCVAINTTSMVVSWEMTTIIKELSNGWYTIGSYFLGKTLSDIPFEILQTLIFGIPSYFLQRQSPSLFRYTGLTSVQILVSIYGQSQGLAIGSLFCTSTSAAVFVAPLSSIPLYLLSGYMIPVSSMPLIYLPMVYISVLYHGFRASLSFMYGFDRCGHNIGQKTLALKSSMMDWFSESFGVVSEASDGNTTTGTGFTTEFVESVTNIVAGDYIREDGEVKSLPLIQYEVIDENCWFHIAAMLTLLVGMRTLAFSVMRMQANRLQ